MMDGSAVGAGASPARAALAPTTVTLAILALACLAPESHAHVGSPDTWFEGPAGPYRVRVVVRAPGVVPGLAEISVRVLEGTPSGITVQPRAWNAGAGGAPPPDVAQPVSGDPHLYSVPLWFMAPTSYGVSVTVSGDRGRGTAVVPVQVVATRRLPMERPLQWTLIALGLFLIVGMVTVFGAAVRESTLPPGETPDPKRRARARLVMALDAVVLTLGIVGGRQWWDALDRAFRDEMYKAPHAVASVLPRDTGAALELAIDDPRWMGLRWTPLIADHGKIMHLFLVREPDLEALAHLHPTMRDSSHFEAPLPRIAAGRYRVYADIVHESGFAQTLTSVVDVPKLTAPAPGADPDDSWYAGPSPVEAASAAAAPNATPPDHFTLRNGSVVSWERGAEPIIEGREFPLRFRVRTESGTPATVEPYMGMAAHAVVMREDGQVFAHLHPLGTVSMASEMALTSRTPADSVPGTLARRLAVMDRMHVSLAASALPGDIEIPYGFPSPGRYRIWLQVKMHGEIMTAPFDAEVRPATRTKQGVSASAPDARPPS